jgi:hypothetical protein
MGRSSKGIEKGRFYTLNLVKIMNEKEIKETDLHAFWIIHTSVNELSSQLMTFHYLMKIHDVKTAPNGTVWIFMSGPLSVYQEFTGQQGAEAPKAVSWGEFWEVPGC